MYVLGVYIETGFIPTIYKKYIYYKLLVLLSILFVHHLLHTKEFDYSTHVGMKPVPNVSNVCPTNYRTVLFMFVIIVLDIS